MNNIHEKYSALSNYSKKRVITMTEMATKTEKEVTETLAKPAAKAAAKPMRPTAKRKIKTKLPIPHLKITYQILVGVVAGMALMLMFWMIIHPKQQIAVVNVNKIVDEFIKTTANKKLAPEKMQKNIEAFGNKLENTLQVVAADKHLLLMPSEAVIAGAKDMTQEVKQNLFEH
jgi:conjugal transfer pilin signal peptidase TrbI